MSSFDESDDAREDEAGDGARAGAVRPNEAKSAFQNYGNALQGGPRLR